LDGSPFAEAALPVAAALARKRRGELRLIHVIEVPEALSDPEDRALAEGYLEQLGTRVDLQGLEVSIAVREARILESIQSEAIEWPADVIVMTTHGRGGVSRFWMGSVTDRFLRASEVPVLVVRTHERAAPAAGPFAPTRVVVPLDGSDLAEAALPYATELASAFGASVYLLRGVTHVGALAATHRSFNPKRLKSERMNGADYLAERADAVRGAGVAVEVEVLTESALAEAITARAGDGLIVLTTNGHGGLDRAVFGSVADKVVRGATCPVLVIRPARPAGGR
jgi:nucleotide-binding universal stress UspA family protein